MKPEVWIKEWAHPLLYCRQDERRLPESARQFLTTFGLPSVVIFESFNSFEISFAPLQEELVSYNATVEWGDFYIEDLDREWGHQVVFGEEEFCNGHASFCVDDKNGAVNRIDCELDDPMCFVNSNIELFGMSLLIAQQWSISTHSSGMLLTAEWLEILADGLECCDPRAFADDKCFWRSLISYLLENLEDDPFDLEITSDPKRSKPRF